MKTRSRLTSKMRSSCPMPNAQCPMNNQTEAAIERFRDANNVAITSLYKFVDFVRTIDSDLSPSEALIIAGYVLHELPELFNKNPGLVNQIQDIATKLKLERSDMSNS